MSETVYRIDIKDKNNSYELTELAKMFLPREELLFCDEEPAGSAAVRSFTVPGEDEMDRNAQKRALFAYLAEETGSRPAWGTLTGVRPVKLFGKLVRRFEGETGSENDAPASSVGDALEVSERLLREDYLLSPEKAALLRQIYALQQSIGWDKSPKAAAVYVGIPFCPTRCLYCSFTSNRYERKASDDYLAALYKEIGAVKRIMERKGLYAESIYIGGGTPSSLDEDQFAAMVGRVERVLVEEKAKQEAAEQKQKAAEQKQKEKERKEKEKKAKNSVASKVLKSVITAVTGVAVASAAEKITGSSSSSSSSKKSGSSSKKSTTTQKAVKKATTAATRTISNEITRSILGNLVK